MGLWDPEFTDRRLGRTHNACGRRPSARFWQAVALLLQRIGEAGIPLLTKPARPAPTGPRRRNAPLVPPRELVGLHRGTPRHWHWCALPCPDRRSPQKSAGNLEWKTATPCWT